MPLRNLGKIFFIGLFLALGLKADVTMRVDKVALYSGDTVTFTLHAQGSDIKFPPIDAIEEFPILGTSDASSIQMINGETMRALSRSYTFSPSHDVTIPSFAIKIAAKTYQTKAQAIKVLTPKASSEGEPFVLALKADKQSAYVGEPITLSMVFKQKVGARADKVEVSELELKEFWVKKNEQMQQEAEGEYVRKQYDYVLFPKKEGDIEIPAIFAKVSTATRANASGGVGVDKFFNDPFFVPMQYASQKIFSNPIRLHVKPLPQNVNLYGDFSIEASVDKTEIEANKPVNVLIRIKGSGNIDDIVKFTPSIPNVSLYADEPKIEASLQKGRYFGEFTEHIALVADRDFTVPSFALTYLDAQSRKVVTKESAPIAIKVNGGILAPAPQLEKKPSIQPSFEEPKNTPEPKRVIGTENYFVWYALIVVLLMGIIASLGWWRYRKRERTPEELLWAQITQVKSDKALFETLLPYVKKDKLFAQTLAALEANIYQNAQQKVDKTALKKWLKHNTI